MLLNIYQHWHGSHRIATGAARLGKLGAAQGPGSLQEPSAPASDLPDSGLSLLAATGRFLPVGVGLRLIMRVGGLVIADRSRIACAPVHAVGRHHFHPPLDVK